MKRLIFLLVLSCATFGSFVPVNPGQEQAVDLIWHEVFCRKDRPPKIRWLSGKELDCEVDGKRGFLVPETADDPMVCKLGFTWSFLETAIAWNGELSFSQVPLTHELWHVANARDGIFDNQHFGPGWSHEKDCKLTEISRVCGIGEQYSTCGIVEFGNRMIIDAGL